MTLAILGVGPTYNASVANPQLQFFNNFPMKERNQNLGYSNGTLSVHAVNIPLSISFGSVVFRLTFSSAAASNFLGSVQFGLYSLNGSTLSLANSAGADLSATTNGGSWISMVTSATQNITPGPWFFAANMFTSGVAPHTSASIAAGGPPNASNANPYFFDGRMTVSTNALPASIATSELDVTGSDALSQPLIIITS